MSRYLIFFALITLTGCATNKKEFFRVASSGITDTPLVRKAVVSHSKRRMKKDTVNVEDVQLLQATGPAPIEDVEETVVKDEVSFDLPVVENDMVRYFVDYYTGPARSEFKLRLERSGRFLPMMREIFAEEGLPLDLCYLAMIESGFDTHAVSRARAVGPWQFMEGTGRIFGLDNNWWLDERRDPLKATRAAARYLDELHRQFDDWGLAIAAYNAGAGKVGRAIRATGSRDFWELSSGGYLKKETSLYLPKLYATLLIAKEPEKYGFSNLNYQPPLEFDVVELPASTDIDVIARLSGVSREDIRVLNPELKRWCTPPGLTGYPVRLPDGKAKSFKRKYADIGPEQRANFRRYRIKSGDTLFSLARRYGIHTKDILALNNIRNPRALRVGRDLVLPLHPDRVLHVAASSGQGNVSTKKVLYKVRSGDTLWNIGRRFNLKADDIMTWNNLESSHILQPGDRLTLKLSQEENG